MEAFVYSIARIYSDGSDAPSVYSETSDASVAVYAMVSVYSDTCSHVRGTVARIC